MNIKELIDRADRGNSESQLAVGKAYYIGEEIPEDLEKAEFYLRKAGESNLLEAQFYLGLVIGNENGRNNPKEALKLLKKAAESGLAKAQCAVGEYYENGWGTETDYATAVEWYKKSADQGYSMGQCRLGSLYYEGQGTTKNVKLAAELFTKAAEADDVDAQAMLGAFYINGDGLPKDLKLAFFWTNKAAESGHSGAQHNLALMYESGKGVEVSLQKAFELFKSSADQGYDEAQRCVGFYHLYGLHVPPDAREALQWFRESADQGNAEAKRYLDHILKVQTELEGIRDQIDPSYFRVAQLLLQIPRNTAETSEMWGWLEKGKKPSKKEANKFFLTCILDYQMKAGYIWSNTRKFVEQKLGDPEDLWGFVLSHSLDEWKQKEKEYKLHRFGTGHMRVWKIGRDLIKLYGGDARAIWEGQEPGDVVQRLHQLGEGEYGVGENIANMIVGALIDTEQIKGVGNVKADTHVRKILGRVFRGYNYGTDEARECTEFARKIYPPNPWLLDQPLYFLGQVTCRDKDPDCPNCFLRQECMYLKKQSLK